MSDGLADTFERIVPILLHVTTEVLERSLDVPVDLKHVWWAW